MSDQHHTVLHHEKEALYNMCTPLALARSVPELFGNCMAALYGVPIAIVEAHGVLSGGAEVLSCMCA